MRCLGRLIVLALLLVVIGVAWLYRDDLRREVDRRLHPAAATSRIGRPSPESLRSALGKLDSLQRTRQDSVFLTAGELASLMAQGSSLLPGAAFDSISVELGDRTVRIRTLVDSASIPGPLRQLLPGAARRYEDVVVRGTLTPVRPGLAELEVQHVTLAGIPLPTEVVSRVTTQLTGKGRDGRLEIVLPQTVGGFRVRPDGVAIYRQGVVK